MCNMRKSSAADLAITGVVQKVSNLILNINIYLRDVHSGRLITAMSADLRGNTDEILVAGDELSGAQPAARAELWRTAAAIA